MFDYGLKKDIELKSDKKERRMEGGKGRSKEKEEMKEIRREERKEVNEGKKEERGKYGKREGKEER